MNEILVLIVGFVALSSGIVYGYARGYLDAWKQAKEQIKVREELVEKYEDLAQRAIKEAEKSNVRARELFEEQYSQDETWQA